MNGQDLPSDVYSVPPTRYMMRMAGAIDSLRNKFCATLDLDGAKLETNTETLRDIIIRIDKRALYFHIFHDGMKPSEHKNLALLVFWILKLRPFWIAVRKDFTKEQFQFASCINEKFCMFLVTTLLLEYSENARNITEAYLKELAYSFRFRDMSKESLFLLFDLFRHLRTNSK